MMILNTPLRHRTAVAVFFFCCGCCFATWASRIPSVKDQFHFNEAELGGVLFMLPLGSFLALPFAGWAVANYGSRVMTFLSALCYALLLAGLGFSHSVVSMSVLLSFLDSGAMCSI